MQRPDQSEQSQPESLTVADAIRVAAGRFADAGVTTARLDAEVLLRHVLELDRTQLFVELREQLSTEDLTRLNALVERRLGGEPVAYLTGRREFMGLSFAVGPGVLVPRPETELLVEWAFSWLKGRPSARVVDVGTGSGAIALSLAAMRPQRRELIIGAEVSEAALRYAAENRRRLGLADAVHLVRGDLITWFKAPVDLVLANLPYLRPEQLASNPDLRAEPANALVSGADGLDEVRRLLADLPRVLATDGAVALEIDPSQAETVRAQVRAALPGARVDVHPDLAGWDRVVVAELGPVSLTT
ncbi:MAG: release factor glutamine methyltransferase [Thermomicrobiales bacterium]|nr:release factor glutamine methyltransferase [Thermomicrobiales bacterium]